MKAISLWNPWAEAMAREMKRNETRSWPTKHRGDLVICSARKVLTEAEIKATNRTCFDLWCEGLAYGFALCVVEVYDCIETERLLGVCGLELELGDYRPGRFIWRTRNCRKLSRPVPVCGRQGIWTIPPETEALIRSSIPNGGLIGAATGGG